MNETYTRVRARLIGLPFSPVNQGIFMRESKLFFPMGNYSEAKSQYNGQ